jgi:predicted nucleotidyltransferase
MNTPARLLQLQTILVNNHLFDLLGLDRIGVFGSFVRGQHYHDIDLLLEKEPGYEKRRILSDVISDALMKPCDVVLLDKLEPIIKYYILNDIQYVQKP